MSKSDSLHWLEEIKEDMKLLKMDGLPNILRSHSLIIRLVWSLILAAFVAVCVALIVGSINEYMHYEVTTKSRVYQEKSSVFPTITLCPVNQLATDRAAQLTLAANASDMLALELYTYNRTGAYMSDALKQSLSNPLDMIIVDCLIGGALCNSSDFQWVWHPAKYNCYRFNAAVGGDERNLVSVNIAGHLNYRFQLNLYTGLANYWSARTTGTRGFYLYIHNSTEYPFGTSPASTPILLTPGFGVQINVERAFYSQFNEWPYAYSECRLNGEDELLGDSAAASSLVEQVKALNYTYSRSTCLLLCAQQKTAEKCNCLNYNIGMRLEEGEDEHDHEWCLSGDQQVCANGLDDDECWSRCPLECEERVLTPTLSFYQYPAYSEAQYIRFYGDQRFIAAHINQTDFTSVSKLYKNLLSVTIFYEALEYSVVEEKPQLTVESLVGLIGGHLHLFLGMSLISFLEIAELIANIINIHCSRNKKKH